MNVFKLKRARNVAVKVIMLLFVMVTTLSFIKVKAETVTYPFRTGDDAFKNAPTWYGDSTAASSDTYQFLQPNFNAVDLSDTTKNYAVAMQIKVATGNPGFTFGLMGNGDRYGTFIDGKTLYTVSNTGTVTPINVLYASINLGAGFEGMLVAPISEMAWVSWASANKSLSKVSGVFIETNALYNYNFSLVIGEIGIYEGDFQNGGTFTKVMDLTNGELKGNYYNARSTDNPLVFASDTKDPLEDKVIDYPFRTGEFAYKNAMLWNGVNQTTVNNWQTMKVNFEETDFSNASYVAVQYNAKAGAPGLTYGLEHGGARYSIAGVADGKTIYMVNEEGTVKIGAKVQYAASTISQSGMLLIPMSAMGWQFGQDADKDLTKISSFVMTTNSYYNWAYEVIVGEMGYYTGTLGEEDFTFHKLIDLTKGDKAGQFEVLSDNPSLSGRISINKIDQKVYGDTTIDLFGTNKQGSDYAIWNGGSFGEVTMGKDTYGDDAIVMKSTGANPNGDAYTAITLADGISYDWSGKKGVTLWARNDSDTELAFNLQLDCLVDVDGDGKKDRGRFNIRQGYQFWLYDLNKGTETIYMTRPEITLPVGFEGWVRIPFTAFKQADWSLVESTHKVIPANYFMSEGSVVGYLAVTIFSGDYTNKTFAINKIGTYTTTPRLSTAVIKDTSKTIRALMGLE